MSATSDLSELFSMIARRDPSVTSDLFDTHEFGERAARVYAALGETAQQRVTRVFAEACRQSMPIIVAEHEGDVITSEIMDFRMRSDNSKLFKAEIIVQFAADDEQKANEIASVAARNIGGVVKRVVDVTLYSLDRSSSSPAMNETKP